MGKKRLWIIIAGLIVTNCLTIAFFLTRENKELEAGEVVATVDNQEITRQDWLNEIEKRYGKDVLKELVDQKVIEQVAKKYNVKVSETAIDRELLLIKTMYGTGSEDSFDQEEWREQIRYSLLLEEILTKDVVVPEEELRGYYDQNGSLYSIPASYHLSQIVVKTEAEAKQALEEIKQGSYFSTLAMERSIDENSAGEGGDIGYVREDDDRFSLDFFKAIKQLEPGESSNPIKTSEGYAIVQLHEKIQGKDYSYQEVKEEIRRQIALDQMEGVISAGTYWDEVNVQWFYEEEKVK